MRVIIISKEESDLEKVVIKKSEKLDRPLGVVTMKAGTKVHRKNTGKRKGVKTERTKIFMATPEQLKKYRDESKVRKQSIICK